MNRTSQPRVSQIPHDSGAEAGALACVLQGDGEASRWLGQLDEADFHDLRHLHIFRALHASNADGDRLDPITLFQKLKASGALDDAGGKEYVSQLPDATPSPANWPTFLRDVKDRSARRAMLAESERLRRTAIDLSVPVGVTTTESLSDKLQARIYSQHTVQVEQPSVYSLAGVPICTPGNLTTVSAQAKAGKTATVGAMIAAAMSATRGDLDCLGFSSSNPKGYALVHLDTEQTTFDHWQLIERARVRSGLSVVPSWLQSFCVTGFSLRELREAIRVTLVESHRKFGGVHSFILDGVADVVADVNDPAESNALVAELHSLAIRYECPLIAIIHLNPSSDFKTRGHLGSQLERKAETNLRLKKEDEIITLFCDKNRRAPIPEPSAPRFAWSDSSQMHVSVGTAREVKRDAERMELTDLRDEVFRLAGPSLGWSDFVAALKRVPTVRSDATAQRRFKAMRETGLITKNLIGQYEAAK